MKTPFSGGRPRPLSSRGIGFTGAAIYWPFAFSVFTLLFSGALSQRVSAGDSVLTDAQCQAWFDPSLNPQVRHTSYARELIDGQAYFGEVTRLLRSIAQDQTNIKHSYIYMINWWMDGTFPLNCDDFSANSSCSLHQLLNTAANAGVEIRGLFWDQSIFVGSNNKTEVQFINSLWNGGAVVDNKTRNYGSHHQKILIIYDAANNELTAFCGGIDFNRDRLWRNGVHEATQAGGPDHDVQCEVRGPAAYDLLQVFVQRWHDNARVSSIPTGGGGNKMGLRAEVWPDMGSTAAYGSAHGFNQWVQVGHTYPPPGGGLPSPYSFAPNGEQTARAMILHAIKHAQRYIYFEDQFMISPEASSALETALKNNSQLQLIILIANWPLIYPWRDFVIMQRNYFLNPLKAVDPNRVHVFVRAAGDGYHNYIHSKTWIFDDEFAIIGSANCNNRSWTWDSEAVAGICDPGNGVRLRMPHRLKDELWAEHLGAAQATLDGLDWKAAVDLWTKNVPLGNHIMPYMSYTPYIAYTYAPLMNAGNDPNAAPLP